MADEVHPGDGDEQDPAGAAPQPAAPEGDALPEDLDVTGFVGPYQFPNNNRRRIPGAIYVGTGLVCVLVWAVTEGGDPVLVNEGVLWAGTNNGLARMEGGKFSHLDTNDGLFSNYVFSMASSTDGQRWVGSFGGVTHLAPAH